MRVGAEHVVDRSRVVMFVLVVVSGTIPEQAADASLRGTGRDLVPECADLIGHESGLSRCIRTCARSIEMSPWLTISISFPVGCVLHGCRLFLDWPLMEREGRLQGGVSKDRSDRGEESCVVDEVSRGARPAVLALLVEDQKHKGSPAQPCPLGTHLSPTHRRADADSSTLNREHLTQNVRMWPVLCGAGGLFWIKRTTLVSLASLAVTVNRWICRH